MFPLKTHAPGSRRGIIGIPARMIFAIFFLSAVSAPILAQIGRWVSLQDTATVIAREECSFAQAGGRFYLLGGRGRPVVQEYNPGTETWKNLKMAPSTFNHFQAVTHHGLIYVIGAFDESLQGYPRETPAANVYAYDPLSDTWVKGMTIPAARQRGSAGLVEHQGKFYVVLGNKLGHTGPGSVFLDEYDPATNAWTPLADGPRARDHFQAAIANGRIYAVGGRQALQAGTVFTDLEKVDVFDIASGKWSTLPGPDSDMKVKRSGGIVATLGDDILYAGGSNPAVFTTGAYNLVDAFNTATNTWRSLAPMNRGRQVTGGFINNSALYVASGSGGTGGTPTLKSMEVFYLKDSLPPVGEALVAGALTAAETSFNMGIVASGRTLDKTFALKHSSGNQGVLISGLKVTGDASFQVKTLVSDPYLVRPTEQTLVELSFASKGTVPSETFLEIAFAVPPGKTLKIPLDANRTAAGIPVFSRRSPAESPMMHWDGNWKFRWAPEPGGDRAAPEIPVYRNALGRAAQ